MFFLVHNRGHTQHVYPFVCIPGGFFALSGIILIPDLGMELAFPGENDGEKNNAGEEPRDRDKQGDGEEPRDEEEPTPVAWWPRRD